MSYLLINNETLIQEYDLMLLGASTKRNDDTKIGRFGSGLKYSIALAMRLGIDIKVYAGTQLIELGKKQLNYRDTSKEVITVNGKETSLTTDMGPDWEPPMIIREIYANAVDESGKKAVITEVDEIDVSIHLEDQTYIYVEASGALELMLLDFDNYFCIERKRKLKIGEDELFFKLESPSRIYYRGMIASKQNEKVSLFDYNFHTLGITETRVYSDISDVYTKVARILYGIDNSAVVEKLLQAITNAVNQFPSQTYNFELFAMNYVNHYQIKSIGNAWINALKDKILVPIEYATFIGGDIEEDKKLLVPKFFHDVMTLKGGIESGIDKFQAKDFDIKFKPNKSYESLIDIERIKSMLLYYFNMEATIHVGTILDYSRFVMIKGEYQGQVQKLNIYVNFGRNQDMLKSQDKPHVTSQVFAHILDSECSISDYVTLYKVLNS